MKKLLWKCLADGLTSGHDGSAWEIGKWRSEKPPTKECVGLNACPRLMYAMQYVPPIFVAQVETGGKKIKGQDKWTCEKMKIVRAWHWKKEDSVALSVFAAELVIGNYEKRYPDDDRPRKAIEAAKAWLLNPTEENRSAKLAAAWSAAWSAELAAARAAVENKFLDKIEAWLMERVKTLEEYKQGI